LILLTGSTGFLGRNFLECSSLKDNLFLINRENHPLDLSVEEYTKIIEDKKITSIVHCGALVGRGKGSQDDYYRVNVDWTLRLAEAFATSHVRHQSFVYISSVGVYGTIPPVSRVDETMPYNADGHYHKSKMMAEKRLKSIASIGDFPLTILRPTIMYGRYDRGFLWKLIRLSKRLILPVPDIWVHLLDVETLIKVIDYCILNQDTSGTFNVADKRPVKLKDLALFLKDRIPDMRMVKLSNRFARCLSWLSTPFKDYADVTLLCKSWTYNAEKMKSMGVETGNTLDLLEKYMQWYRF